MLVFVVSIKNTRRNYYYSAFGDSVTGSEHKIRSEKEPLRSPIQRKLKIGNGYLLELDQLARVLSYLLKRSNAKRISRKELQQETGLPDRQIEGLVSMGSAMGLIKPHLQVLTASGCLVAKHDIFFEKKGTLEWCHYNGAGSYRNLIWYEMFNRLRQEKSPMAQKKWTRLFRTELLGKYSKKTLCKGISYEVYFVIDAYMHQNLSKLGLFEMLPDNSFYSRRYTDFVPPVFAAMVYDFFNRNNTRFYQVVEIADAPGSPASVFKLDAESFRQQIEDLHERGWLRYETTHNLDQIRLKPDFCALEFLMAYYEDRAPCTGSNLTSGGSS